MNKKKYAVILIFVSLLLIGCSKNSMTSIYDNYMTSIYDDNEKISSTTNSYSLNGIEQSINGQQFRANIKRIEGMDTLWTYESDEDRELDMTYLISVTSGKLKLVLISPDNSVTNIIERTNQLNMSNYDINTLHIKKGLNRIKLVAGKDTSAQLDITIPDGKLKKLG
ncbi:putative lipoprotein [Clostridium sp. DL-VIII]|uniref:hypothetical protein n=1 Tax=Clostridium sp. DL-VIII TaxID=641107 RepID=UPI00023AF4E8|nr:hypothetical protein [Clostridium sp. DL-VIII]EHI97276.1 putative lipoprotein [Clostridium sp. DL-VIII]